MYIFLSRLYQKVKYYGRVISKREVYFPLGIRIGRKLLGNYNAEWCIAKHQLKPNDIVYSFGVGTDISFDLCLIAEYNCQVFAFDPTPVSKEWLSTQELPASFHFKAYGIANEDGVIRFYPPKDPAHVSFSTKIISNENAAVELPVLRLKSIMDFLGHKKIDLLKMDIEGGEYDVIDDLAGSEIEVRQLLVEFHHRFDQINLDKTRNAINTLRRNGFKIFYISPSGEEYSFIKRL